MASSVLCLCFLGPFFIWFCDFVYFIAYVDLVMIDWVLLIAVFRWASPHLCRCSKMGLDNNLLRPFQCSQSCFRHVCFKVRLVGEGSLNNVVQWCAILRGSSFWFCLALGVVLVMIIVATNDVCKC